MTSLTRRSTLALLGAATGALALPRRTVAAPIPRLALYGPPAGPSITLAHAVTAGLLTDIADETRFTAWRSPDELRAGLTSGEILASVVPIQAAANLYNRGFPIRLANAMTNGLLYVLAEDPGIAAIPDLAGRHIAVPFRGDTPEIIFGQLLAHYGLGPDDLQITYAGTPTEAMQLMLAGRVDAALTAEPSTTAAVLRGREAGKQIRRAINLQNAWGEMTGAAPVLPQAGLALTGTFLAEHGETVPALLTALEQATADVLAKPQAAAAHATKALGLPAPLLAASIPHANLVARPATEARADIERMLTAMGGTDLARIGGALPDDAFYL
ncbi:putative sulfonate/nitrate transport system substrate-binding protein [Dinoroseobacter shibae DFL 12 = DSM 16493]|jgi:NitT/TauT family transport system substrate-binding protein|uniref:Putative sulfonate/nitrate transport system substrate-binding protein n=1 Tax=Dinoroseobacter shibae (strain DSM 16493 / NCIMB 14021 / DFL 12) TaxID=398580 RepID=A8LJH3_DINSH|nr:ABC transporter substrate-binding protein [Dinoroseobacter shibae]ABV93195.1 putative sulfonate/nitrate transport system substrate-binding protein [Dinoroseobacter shibae DFL 12 = DSM 16493]URF48118.1 ABC transporter substrate-binding protein [Dinoroseobacter shibae]URF52428.1 ABC transporter substrate-binding protein [Dinoroseobacter shibae]